MCQTQETDHYMRYQTLSAGLYERNRNRLYEQMDHGSVAILFSNDILPTNADGNMAFKQNSDLFYLSGIDQEETVLVLFPHAHQESMREMLFVKETNKHIAIWEGEKYSKEQAKEASGVPNIFWLDQLEAKLKAVMAEAEHVYLNNNEHTRKWVETETRQERLNKALQEKYPLHSYKRLAPLMHALRAVKQPEEIEQMQRACNITRDAFHRIMQFVKPGQIEYELEAEAIHEFTRKGSRGFAYNPIFASGANACTLHYDKNDTPIADGDLILMDFGCEYGNYASDLTRCIPANGRFSARQKQIYNAVLDVQKACYNILTPGASLYTYHQQVGEVMTEKLLELGLITRDEVKKQNPDWPAYKKYFMHGTSHFIGLDTHDVGLWHEPIPENSAFTIEPGIYIKEEGIGVRIENDIIITRDGYRDLMADIPREVEEIEEIMNAR